MALTPLAPAALPVLSAVPPPPAPVPALTIDAAVAVTPADQARRDGGTQSATQGATQGARPGKPQGAAQGAAQSGGGQSALEKALAQINAQMEAWATEAQFEIDPDTNRVVVSLKDAKTGEVIKTIPSEAIMQMARTITELQGKAIKTTA